MALILASSSAIRRAMLDHAGIPHIVEPSEVDERFIKSGSDNPSEIAAKLAAAKALDVSRRRSDGWVVGADSIVSVEGRLFDKPKDRSDAAKHLRFFSGKPMKLTSAVALAIDGKLDWTHSQTAYLQVRPLSDEFIAAYLDAEWPEVGYTVGVFRLEARGVQLFERLDGDHFTILGMPLIPLLGALRERGLLLA